MKDSDLLKAKMINAAVRDSKPYFFCAGCEQYYFDIREHLNDQTIDHVRKCRYAYRAEWGEQDQ